MLQRIHRFPFRFLDRCGPVCWALGGIAALPWTIGGRLFVIFYRFAFERRPDATVSPVFGGELVAQLLYNDDYSLASHSFKHTNGEYPYLKSHNRSRERECLN